MKKKLFNISIIINVRKIFTEIFVLIKAIFL